MLVVHGDVCLVVDEVGGNDGGPVVTDKDSEESIT